MTKYNLQFLEEKLGPFKKEYQYPTKPISGFNLVYIETKTKKELDGTVKEVKDEINPGYIWGYVIDSNAVYVTRAFGENKIFIYNPTTIKQTDYVKGKLKVLNNITTDNINDLFDQKAVFDYFYRKLWDLRLDLGKEIRDHNNISDNIALMAAQHIIDRIIFTYFLCEKKLVTLNGNIPLDSKTLFNSLIKMPNPWNCLKNLFFEQFAKKKSKPLLLGKNAQIITPYLNGGLFRPKKLQQISESDLKIEFSQEQWKDLFDPLNKYSWIIEDEMPDHEGEYEGNLTPEIIGHIYEKFVITMETLDEINLDEINISQKGDLKKGNKKIGAYYTPEQITDYISRETIKPFLFDKLGITNSLSFQEFLDNSSLETFQKALKILDEMTICDPACGSGAFLIKAGEVLLEYKTKLLNRLNDVQIDRYMLKKEIIIKNLYGVDIQEGAVEICKLRLWLWLISSSQNSVEPLPNIEYNFIVGNSLVGWSKERLDQHILVKLDEMVLTLVEALKLRYQNDNIDIIIKKLNKTDMKSYAEAMSLLKNLYSYSNEDEAEQLKKIIETIRKSIYKEINRIFYDQIQSKGKKLLFTDYENLRPFNWKVDFYKIFDNGGFDVIIGNPPYVRHQKIVNLKLYLEKQYLTYTGRSDLYVYFFEKGFDLLKEEGMFAFICSNKFTKSSYGKPLRKLLLNYQIKNYTDFTRENVFPDVTVDPCVIIIKKVHTSPNNVICVDNDFMLEQFRLNEDIWSFEPPKVLDLKDKIEGKGLELKEVIEDIKKGLITGYNKAFIIDEQTKNDLINEDPNAEEVIKPLIRGKDVKRWQIDYNKLYLLYIPWKFPLDNYPSIKNHLQNHKKGLESRTEVKNGNIDWYVLRRYAPDYNHEFELPKIIYPEISSSLFAVYDVNHYYMNNKCFFITSSNLNLKYLSLLLSSKTLNFVFRLSGSQLGKSGYELLRSYIEKLPIIPLGTKEQDPFIKKADLIYESNAKLQRETVSFKRWLSSVSNLEETSLNLDEYYKKSEREFIDELKKKKVDLIVNDEIISEKFNSSVLLIKPLIKKIKITEKEIDSMIFELYELNEKEIQIIKDFVKD